MLSVASQSTQVSFDGYPKIPLNELGNLHDAVKPFTSLILTSGKPAIRLHCTIPTWGSPTDTCTDLHDLHDLRSRFIPFVHDLLKSLRSSGIVASYSLVPSNSCLCLVCALPPQVGTKQIKASDLDLLQKACYNKRENVLLADLENGPCLVIT